VSEKSPKGVIPTSLCEISRQQNGTGNQHNDPETDSDKEGAQPEQDQDAQPQQQKQPRMLTNLARYNTPGIKDNEHVTGKRNQRDRHHMADECEKKRDRIAQSDIQHKEKQQRLMETIRAEMYAQEQESTSSNATTPHHRKHHYEQHCQHHQELRHHHQ
jgi:hypothetical protein